MSKRDPLPAWEPFDLFVIRSAGFPYALLEPLRSADLVAEARNLVCARTRLEQLQERFFRAIDKAGRSPAPEDMQRVRTLLQGVRKRRAVDEAVGNWAEIQLGLPGWTADWNAAVSALRASAAAFPRLYESARENARTALRALLREPRIREAIYLLTPEVLDRSARHLLERLPTLPTPNQDERKVITFIQRLCSKCETNAFAGPIAYGTLDPAYPEFVDNPQRNERRGFVAHWAIRELAWKVLMRDGHVAARSPRRGPAADLAELPAAARRLLDAIDGVSTWEEVARLAAMPVPGLNVIERFERAGLAWTAVPVPASEPDALFSLERGLDEDRDRQSAQLVRQLRALTQEFAGGGIEEKSSALRKAEQLLSEAGVTELRRGAGEVYTDRVVLYEEDYDGARSQVLPHPGSEIIREALAPVLDIAAAATFYALEQVREQTRQDFARIFPGRETVPFSTFLKHIPLSRPVQIDETPPIQALQRLLRDTWDGERLEVEISREQIERVLAPFLPSDEHILLASPDVLLAASSRDALRTGELDVIVGEIHWGLQLFGNLCCFVADRPGLLGAAREWLSRSPASSALVNVALGNRFGKMCFLEVMPRTLEISGPAAPERLILRPSDLSVTRDGHLQLAATGERVTLLSGDLEGRVYTPFAPPALRLPTIRLGERTPRIRIGRAIVQRATWWVPAQDFAAIQRLPAADHYLALVSCFARRGIPDRVFARLEHEPKPLHVDIGSPHLADMLIRAVRAGEVKLTEMLPGPDALWQEGRPCEFRFAFLKRAQGT